VSRSTFLKTEALKGCKQAMEQVAESIRFATVSDVLSIFSIICLSHACKFPVSEILSSHSDEYGNGSLMGCCKM
jgi:hypothetical protein